MGRQVFKARRTGIRDEVDGAAVDGNELSTGGPTQ